MAIVDRPATGYSHGAESRANQYTGPACSAKVCFMVVGNITTVVNKGRQ